MDGWSRHTLLVDALDNLEYPLSDVRLAGGGQLHVFRSRGLFVGATLPMLHGRVLRLC